MRDIIKTILYSWKSRKLPEIIERDVDLSEYSSLDPKKIIVITGFRRSGKTRKNQRQNNKIHPFVEVASGIKPAD